MSFEIPVNFVTDDDNHDLGLFLWSLKSHLISQSMSVREGEVSDFVYVTLILGGAQHTRMILNKRFAQKSLVF